MINIKIGKKCFPLSGKNKPSIKKKLVWTENSEHKLNRK